MSNISLIKKYNYTYGNSSKIAIIIPDFDFFNI